MAIHIALPATVLVLVVLYKYIIQPIFFSPLSKIPSAHITSPIAPLWLLWNTYIEKENSSLFKAHQKHGSIIRLGPSEVSVCSLDGLRKIYLGNFERSEWFANFKNYDGTPNLVTIVGRKNHANRKRFLTHIYSKSYILNSQDFHILTRIILFERLLPWLSDRASKGVDVDVLQLNYALGAEFMTAYEMGIQNGLRLIGDQNEKQTKAYLNYAKLKLWELKGKEEAIKALEDNCLEMCDRAEETLKQQSSSNSTDHKLPGTEDTSFPVVYSQLRTSLSTKEGIEDPQQLRRLVASEMIDNIEAAREAGGIALTYIFHQLCKHPDIQTALHDELHTLTLALEPLNMGTIIRAIDGLPLLDAIIIETLRLFTAAPGRQRRIVPPGGVVVDGYFIPGGVEISSSAYCIHRHPGAFPDADVWRPERWMTNGQAGYGEKAEDLETGRDDNNPRRWFWAFGNGGRMCIGSNFMLLVMKVVVATIYTNLKTSIVDDEGIEQRDAFMGAPKGDKIILKFEHY